MASTSLLVMVLRETINVLPMLIAVLLLVLDADTLPLVMEKPTAFAFLESVAAVVAITCGGIPIVFWSFFVY